MGPMCNVDSFAEPRFAVDVGHDQVALLVRDFELVTVLLPNLHVLESVDAPRGEHDPLARVIVHPGDRILFLRVRGLPSYAWNVDGSDGTASGSFRIEIRHPSQMYEAFLRHTEEISSETFFRVTTSVVEGAAIERFEHDPGSKPTSADLRQDLEPRLTSLGLHLSRFEFATQERSPAPAGVESVRM